jgi:hypothetical protein
MVVLNRPFLSVFVETATFEDPEKDLTETLSVLNDRTEAPDLALP